VTAVSTASVSAASSVMLWRQSSLTLQTLLPILGKVFLVCGFVSWAAAAYQAIMLGAAWRHDQ
jgi:hypothetical protein